MVVEIFSIRAVRCTYGSGVHTVQVYIRFIGTHAEYDRINEAEV